MKVVDVLSTKVYNSGERIIAQVNIQFNNDKKHFFCVVWFVLLKS